MGSEGIVQSVKRVGRGSRATITRNFCCLPFFIVLCFSRSPYLFFLYFFTEVTSRLQGEVEGEIMYLLASIRCGAYFNNTDRTRYIARKITETRGCSASVRLTRTLERLSCRH